MRFFKKQTGEQQITPEDLGDLNNGLGNIRMQRETLEVEFGGVMDDFENNRISPSEYYKYRDAYVFIQSQLVIEQEKLQQRVDRQAGILARRALGDIAR